mgnify:CR=1 FL=1
MEREDPRVYLLKQYVYDRAHGERNEWFESLDDLVTHHPFANVNARMQAGVLAGVEKPHKRSHAFMGGEFQEIEALRTDEYRALDKDQVLLVKDFILSDRPPERHETRAVDVPSPVAGVIGRVDARNGLVDVCDPATGGVIARIRHLEPIAVSKGDLVDYGQALGTQNNAGLGPKDGVHVHLEMDTRYYQQFENYIADLQSGRLPVQASLRSGLVARDVVDDAVARLGERGERVEVLQRALALDGYRASDGSSIPVDGVYRPNMQGAVLAFQQDHGLAQTGDIDANTYEIARRLSRDMQLAPVPPRDAFGSPLLDAPPGSMIDSLNGVRYERPIEQRRPLQESAPPLDEDPANTGRKADPAHRHHGAGALPEYLQRGDPQAAARPEDRLSPEDRALLGRIRECMHGLDRAHNRTFDDAGERACWALLPLAKERGITNPQHAVVSIAGPNTKAGEFLFLVQGALDNPAHLRTQMKTMDAMQTPIDSSLARVEQVNQDQTRRQAIEPLQEAVQTQAAAHRLA